MKDIDQERHNTENLEEQNHNIAQEDEDTASYSHLADWSEAPLCSVNSTVMKGHDWVRDDTENIEEQDHSIAQETVLPSVQFNKTYRHRWTV